MVICLTRSTSLSITAYGLLGLLWAWLLSFALFTFTLQTTFVYYSSNYFCLLLPKLHRGKYDEIILPSLITTLAMEVVLVGLVGD